MNENDIKSTVKTFVLNEFLPGEEASALTDVTPLITAGILDSLAILKMATFLESHFGITLQPHEMGVDHLNSVGDIARLVASKKS